MFDFYTSLRENMRLRFSHEKGLSSNHFEKRFLHKKNTTIWMTHRWNTLQKTYFNHLIFSSLKKFLFVHCQQVFFVERGLKWVFSSSVKHNLMQASLKIYLTKTYLYHLVTGTEDSFIFYKVIYSIVTPYNFF